MLSNNQHDGLYTQGVPIPHHITHDYQGWRDELITFKPIKTILATEF